MYNPHLDVVIGARPSHAVTNADLAPLIGMAPEPLEELTGIASRSYSQLDVEEMATRVALAALEAGKVTADEIDCVVAASSTEPSFMPPLAPRVADNIGAKYAGGFDVQAGCAGFCYALGVAHDMIYSGSAKKVLVVAAERLSLWLDKSDPSTTAVFGDGAGAALVTRGDERSIWPTATLAHGASREDVTITPRDVHAVAQSQASPTIRVNGASSFRWGITHGPRLIEKALSNAAAAAKDIDVFIPHQNMRVARELHARMPLSHARLCKDGRISGNTSSASVPLGIASMLATEHALPGDKALLFAFGAGTTAASLVVKLPTVFTLIADLP